MARLYYRDPADGVLKPLDFMNGSDGLYVNVDGDTMTGPLVMQPSPSTNPQITLDVDEYPMITWIKSGAPLNKKRWVQYVSGATGSAENEYQHAMTFLAEDDDGTDQVSVRFYRTGRVLIGADPVNDLEVATKRYVDTHPGERGLITPATGFQDHGYGLYATKVGETLVNLDGQFRVTTTYTSDGYSRLLGTIPVGFRPTKTAATTPGVLIVGSPTTAAYACVVVAQSDGQLRWVIANGIAVNASAATYVSVNITYRLGA